MASVAPVTEEGSPSQKREMSFFVSTHALRSKERGASEVEQVAQAIEQRRAERIEITQDVQVAMLEDCLTIALDKNYEIKSKIKLYDLLEYRVRISSELENQKKGILYHALKLLGFRYRNEQLMEVLDRAVAVVDTQRGMDREFHYMDFNAYYTKVESRWPWMRSGVSIAVMYVLLLYICTPIFFCKVVKDPGICPKGEDDGLPSGWSSALYFASETLSSVGYGDLTVNLKNPYHVLAGIFYIMVANMTLIASFSYALNLSWNPLGSLHERMVKLALGEATHDEPLHVKLSRLRTLRISELVGGFVLLNLIGVFANRFFLMTTRETLQTDWTWLVSFYWAAQTTTTIGYGDLDQPTNQRWFQIFYLIYSTYFAGNALAGLASLREELEQVRREYAWGRREISKNLIDEFQAAQHDGKIDQYEFLVASLVQLGKITSEDVIPIMDKFRSLAGDSGFVAQQSGGPVAEATDQEIQNEIDDLTFLRRHSSIRLERLRRENRAGASLSQTTECVPEESTSATEML